MSMSDIDIAQAATLRRIEEVAGELGVPEPMLYRYGPHKAKVDLGWLATQADRPAGRLVLVTAITPTPAGEGKTTTTVGLGDGLRRLGHRAAICLREPSLGPVFGMKGGAAGGGYAQIVPMEDINLHFTGDLHAITAANNLLAAMLDNHLHWGNALDIDPRRIYWRRALDMNDRALRQIVVGLGGLSGGIPREDGFDISVASEVMAVFCLATDAADLKARLGRIVVAETRDRRPVTARDLEADGAMAALLKDALMPNLVQSLEGTPAFVHGGPFANIAHGCNSVMATRASLKLADVVVTEAGFGADLGAEKFFDIKCRQTGLRPDCVVVVATVRALKMHGGRPRDQLGTEDLAALGAGMVNLERHLENLAKFGVPAVVAINRFSADTEAELELVRSAVAGLGASAHVCTHWADGGAGTAGLAAAVAERLAAGEADFRPLYPDAAPLAEKIGTVAREIYRADGIQLSDRAAARIRALEENGYAGLPVCIAKTQYSFSADPARRGAPTGHVLPVREVRLSAGAGFVVAVCGDIMTMPGLPRSPAATRIDIDDAGRIRGLF